MAKDTVISFRVAPQTKENIDKLAEMLSEQMGMPVSKIGAIGFAVKHMLDNGIMICSASQPQIVNQPAKQSQNPSKPSKQEITSEIAENQEKDDQPLPPLPEPFDLDQEVKLEIGLHARQNLAEIFMQQNLRHDGIKGKAIPFEMLYDIYKAWIAKAKPGESQFNEQPLNHVAFCKTIIKAIQTHSVTIDPYWEVSDYLLEPEDIPDNNAHINKYNLRRWKQPVPRAMYQGLIYNDPNA